jgi:hypothetical protein
VGRVRGDQKVCLVRPDAADPSPGRDRTHQSATARTS